MRPRLLLPFLLGLTACSAAATPRDLAAAERLEHEGRDPDAATAYERAAASTCGPRQPARWCAASLAGRAAALDRLGDRAAAADAYQRIPEAVPGLPDAAAAALVSAANLRLALGDDRRAYDLYWRVLTGYPDESAAEDALRHVLTDGRRRDPRQLAGVLRDLYLRLASTAVADNLLFALSDLAQHELDDPLAAIDADDRLAAAYPRSPLRDDALWDAAQLLRARHDAAGALRRLRSLLATREESWIIGSYHSVRLDDAQLESGLILRDDLGRPRQALAAFARLGRDYPESTLRDDALMELAATHAALGQAAAACRALADLDRRFPESSQRLARAPELAAKLGCRR